MRRAAGPAVVLGFAVVLAVALSLLHPLLAAVPLVVLGLPAGLMLGATIRHGDPYDVSHKYPPGSVAPRE